MFDDLKIFDDDKVQGIFSRCYDVVMNAVKDAVKQHIAELERENDELQKYRLIAERMEQEIKNAERNAKKARIEELVKPFTQKVWYVDSEFQYAREKCDLCDEHRERKFVSPCGREMKELCTCAERKLVYFVREAEHVSLEKNNERLWYRYEKIGFDNDEHLYQASVYDGLDFSVVCEATNVIFLEKANADAFCAYLQEKWDKKNVKNK